MYRITRSNFVITARNNAFLIAQGCTTVFAIYDLNCIFGNGILILIENGLQVQFEYL